MHFLRMALTLLSRSLQKQVARSTTAIIAIADCAAWSTYPSIVLFLDAGSDYVNGMNVCYAEFLALLAAACVQNVLGAVPIRSDCQEGAIKLFESAVHSTKRSGKTKVWPITGVLRTISALPDVTWVPSHPERSISVQLDFTWITDLAASDQLIRMLRSSL